MASRVRISRGKTFQRELIAWRVSLPSAMPIMPLSQLAEVACPRAVNPRKRKLRSRRRKERGAYETVLEKNRHKIRRFGEEAGETKIWHEGRNILNIERHLCPYPTFSSIISEPNVLCYPSRRCNQYLSPKASDTCGSCDFGDFSDTLYSQSSCDAAAEEEDDVYEQLDNGKVNLSRAIQQLMLETVS